MNNLSVNSKGYVDPILDPFREIQTICEVRIIKNLYILQLIIEYDRQYLAD